jgi:uncharacterized protein GlcG (DUF336 family)
MLKRMMMATAMSALVATGATAADDDALISFKVMTPETALEAAQAALADCRQRGFQVAIAVLDRFGVTQVILRDRFAGPHTPETARRKAWTAVSFRTDTNAMVDVTQAGAPQSGVRHVPGALMIGGGVQVQAAGTLVGAIGVSGAPSGEMDDACAKAGIVAIEEKLAF